MPKIECRLVKEVWGPFGSFPCCLFTIHFDCFRELPSGTYERQQPEQSDGAWGTHAISDGSRESDEQSNGSNGTDE